MKDEKRLFLFNAFWNSGLVLIMIGLLSMDKNMWAGLFASIFGVMFLILSKKLLAGCWKNEKRNCL